MKKDGESRPFLLLADLKGFVIEKRGKPLGSL